MSEKESFPGVDYKMVDYHGVTNKPKKSGSRKARCFYLSILPCILIICIALFLLFVIFPIIFKYSDTLQRFLLFGNFESGQTDYQHPEKYGLEGSRNFYITTDDNVTLGAWQILPSNLENYNQTEPEFFDKILDNGQNVVIYNHGNGGSRIDRAVIYKVLRKHFHVIAFDYRGYGDSSDFTPSESALVNDTANVYRWVRNQTNGNIFLWGHSLGASISAHSMLKIQSMDKKQPTGLILESSFNNLKDEISEFPLAKFFSFLPWFNATVVEPVSEKFKFETDKYICDVNVPVLMLHAEDDVLVPYKLAHKLFKAAQECTDDSPKKIVHFHSFDKTHHYGHMLIFRAIDFPDIISDFIDLALKIKNRKQVKNLIEKQ